MNVLGHISYIALLATTVLADKVQETTTLKPIIKNYGLEARAEDPAVAPSTAITVDYGVDSKPLVNIKFDMQKPAVLLEEVLSLKNVTCTGNSITVSFSSKDAFLTAMTAWSNNDDLVFLTNHLGGCDTENERGVFLIDHLNGTAETWTITASAQKKAIASLVANTAITFSGVPVAKKRHAVVEPMINTRDITNAENFTINGHLSIPDNTPIYSFPPYLDVSAQSADVSAGITFSGYLDYHVMSGTLKELYVDIDSHFAAEAAFNMAVKAEYRDSFSYPLGDVKYTAINIPGILSLGPELLFSIGFDLDLEGGLNISATASASLDDGRMHLDFVDSNKTTATPWTPVYKAKIDVSERSDIKADIWASLTFQLMVEVMNTLDLTAGLTARPRFNNEFTTAFNQTEKLVCANGIGLTSDFSFSLIAFVADLRYRVANLLIPGIQECYTWP